MRIAIVNDLALAVEVLRRAVLQRPEHQVIWVARNGIEAVELCQKDRPDVILMDLIMPGMDGVEATRRIMAQSPCAIVIVTASVGARVGKVFEAMGHGALDAVNTPTLDSSDPAKTAAPLLSKIDTIRRLITTDQERSGGGTPKDDTAFFAVKRGLVAIGSSAGGPAALAVVLRALPRQFPAAVVVIQHVDEQFAPGLVEWLGAQSILPVRLAREGDRPLAGTVLVAGTSDHLTFVRSTTLGYTPHPVECAYRPSVDVFFTSMIEHWRGDALGVLLTGMGRDGARGLRDLRDAGHPTIAQDRATSAVYGMPKAAAELKAAEQILPLCDIAPAIMRVFCATNP